MPTTPRQWDEKYRAGAEGPAQEPTTILRELLPLLPKGPALDLACGTGRNALFLMYRQPVTAVDRSESALEVIEHRARKAGIGVCRGTQIDAARAGVCVISADLETATAAQRTICVDCLHEVPGTKALPRNGCCTEAWWRALI